MNEIICMTANMFVNQIVFHFSKYEWWFSLAQIFPYSIDMEEDPADNYTIDFLSDNSRYRYILTAMCGLWVVSSTT